MLISPFSSYLYGIKKPHAVVFIRMGFVSIIVWLTLNGGHQTT